MKSLFSGVRSGIRDAGAGSRPDTGAGDVRVDPASRRVWRGESIVDVTAFELSDDGGSRYDVEVTLAGSEDVDVSLDANFSVVHVDGESDDEPDDD